MLHQHIFQNKFKNNRGYVALMSVLIVSAVGVMIAISLLTLGISYQRSSFILEQSYSAEAIANACSNVALEKIRLDAMYMGGETINFGANYCNILSIIKNIDVYTINTEGVVGSILRKNKIVVSRSVDIDTGAVFLVIDSWQDVADF